MAHKERSKSERGARPAGAKIKPISPTRARRELASLEEIYNGCELGIVSPEAYAAAKARISKALEMWGRA